MIPVSAGFAGLSAFSPNRCISAALGFEVPAFAVLPQVYALRSTSFAAFLFPLGLLTFSSYQNVIAFFLRCIVASTWFFRCSLFGSSLRCILTLFSSIWA